MARREYSLVGIDGNAFCIMGYVATAMSQEMAAMGWNIDELKKAKDDYIYDAMSGNYEHLVAVSAEMVERINSAINGGNEDDDDC